MTKFLCVLSIVFVICGCMTVSTQESILDKGGTRMWWGNKKDITTFLDSSDAKATYWLLQALD